MLCDLNTSLSYYPHSISCHVWVFLINSSSDFAFPPSFPITYLLLSLPLQDSSGKLCWLLLQPLYSLSIFSCRSWKCSLSQPPLQLPCGATSANSGWWDGMGMSWGLLGKVSLLTNRERFLRRGPFPSISSFLLWTMLCEQVILSTLLQPPCAHKWGYHWRAEIAEQRDGRSLCPHPWVANPALEFLSLDLLSWGILEPIEFCYLPLRASPLAWPCSLLIMLCLPTPHPPRFPSFQSLTWSIHRALRWLSNTVGKMSPSPLGQGRPETLSDALFWILLLPLPLKDWGGRTFLSQKSEFWRVVLEVSLINLLRPAACTGNKKNEDSALTLEKLTC